MYFSFGVLVGFSPLLVCSSKEVKHSSETKITMPDSVRKAIKKSDVSGEKAVRKFVDEDGGNTEVRDKNDMTLLMMASVIGREKTMRVLIDKKANVNAEKRGVHLLMVVLSDLQQLYKSESKDKIINRLTKVFDILLEAGADINAKDSKGNSIYKYAKKMDVEAVLVKPLIEKNSDDQAAKIMKNEKIQENSFLFEAARLGKLKTVTTLVKNGADVNAVKTYDEDPYIAESPYSLRKGGEVEETPLIEAIRFNHKDVVRFLVDNKANINIEIKGLKTPFLKAIGVALVTGDLEIIKFLLDKGANINQKTGDTGATPLMLLIREEVKKETWSSLGKYGTLLYRILPNVYDFETLSEGGDAKKFFEWNSMPNAQVDEKDLRKNKFIILEFLINSGADVSIKDATGKTALDYAKEVGIEKELQEIIKNKKQSFVEEKLISDVASIVSDYEYAPETALSEIKEEIGSAKDQKKLSNILASNPAVLKEQDGSGYTPLLTAVEWNNLDAAGVILKFVVDTNKNVVSALTELLSHKNSSGLNAWGLAQHKESEAMLKLLLPYYEMAGIATKEMSEFSKKPQQALFARFKTAVDGYKTKDIEEVLNQAPTLWRYADEQGMTPLLYAVEKERSQAIDAILSRLTPTDLQEIVKQKNSANQTAIDIATLKNNQNLVVKINGYLERAKNKSNTQDKK